MKIVIEYVHEVLSNSKRLGNKWVSQESELIRWEL